MVELTLAQLGLDVARELLLVDGKIAVIVDLGEEQAKVRVRVCGSKRTSKSTSESTLAKSKQE